MATMRRRMAGSFASFLLYTLATASAMDASRNGATIAMPLFARDGAPQCSTLKGLKACPNSSPFCCSTNSDCVPVTSSSVICCPQGSNCDFIEAITCDISQQDASKWPYNMLHTTDLNAKLPTCGSMCCPAGYTCRNGNICQVDASATTSAPTDAPTSSTTPALPTGTTTSLPVVIPSDLPTSTPAAQSTQGSHVNIGAVLAGVFLGLLALVAVIFVLWKLNKRKKNRGNRVSIWGWGKNAQQGPYPGSSYPGGPAELAQPSHRREDSKNSYVSEPKQTDQYGGIHRTDFLLRKDAAYSSPSNTNTTRSPDASNNSTTHSPGANTIPSYYYHHGQTPHLGQPQQDAQMSGALSPEDTPSRKQNAIRSGRMPLFASTPLKFGVPLNPRGGHSAVNSSTAHVQPPRPLRPKRSEEDLRGLIAQHTDEHQQSLAPGISVVDHDDEDRPGLKRNDSNESNESGESHISIGSSISSHSAQMYQSSSSYSKTNNGHHATNPSKESIPIGIPAPLQPQMRQAPSDNQFLSPNHAEREKQKAAKMNDYLPLPPPPIPTEDRWGIKQGHESTMSTRTTFSQMMEGFGLRRQSGAPPGAGNNRWTAGRKK